VQESVVLVVGGTTRREGSGGREGEGEREVVRRS